MEALLTPAEITHQLSELGRELDAAVRMLRDAELAAIERRHEADLAESRAFLSADGPIEQRKHLARVEVERLSLEALKAEAAVRYLKSRIAAINTRIDVGRSLGAAVRAELKTLSYAEEP